MDLESLRYPFALILAIIVFRPLFAGWKSIRQRRKSGRLLYLYVSRFEYTHEQRLNFEGKKASQPNRSNPDYLWLVLSEKHALDNLLARFPSQTILYEEEKSFLEEVINPRKGF